MNYISTRDTNEAKKAVSAAAAIKQGLADDGGLFMPDTIPTVTMEELKALIDLPYEERAAKILGLFLTDYTAEELLADCRAAYAEERFPGGAAPIVSLEGGVHSLELWHGPTCAFKDMALQIMPRLLSRALGKTGEERTAQILVATSGDTGKAALEGYRDVDQIKILVFYPEDGVSRVQKLQMATQEGGNVGVCAIHGNFDDAQTGVKKIFSDGEFAKEMNAQGYFFSSANSINWGRLAPQIVYYISAYCDLVKAGRIALGDVVNVCVPTGNFGNIFAAYIAAKMGLPVGRFICASNANNILTDFLKTGTYDRNREFYKTMSPSMDILISSNLERLLFTVAGPEKTADYMKSLATCGKYTVDAQVKAELDRCFSGYYCSEENTAKTIRETFEKEGYLCDTHTAVGLYCAKAYMADTDDHRPVILASTANPYKFAASVLTALGGQPTDDVAALAELEEKSGVKAPVQLTRVLTLPVRFTETVDADEMPNAVRRFCK
ncbi:MAG: threonine synthase [Clostridia bacterium]|nr:threonine synthase [Clostridia bacterium]